MHSPSKDFDTLQSYPQKTGTRHGRVMSVAILFLDAGQENGGAVGMSDLMLDS